MSTATVAQPITHITASNLAYRDYWTRGAIKKFLGEPDEIEAWSMGRKSGAYHRYLLSRIQEAETTPEWASHVERLERLRNPKCKALDLLTAIQEISRAAHRWRDAAQAQYQAGNHGLAGSSKWRKEYLYGLKDRGIVQGYRDGLLRYAGTSPQGMAVYEYGDGGMSCFHSTLHPVGVERTPIEGHPETLFVAAKKARHLLRNAEYTLESLPSPGLEFERSAKPVRSRPPITCYRCGEEGHIARECYSDVDEYEYEAVPF